MIALFFFFFQAEDGIRDLTVTGVQTCALPISADQMRLDQGEGTRSAHHRASRQLGRVLRHAGIISPRPFACNGLASAHPRSEERRVGKECRSRWSPYH